MLIPNLPEDQEKSKAPSVKDRFRSKVRELKPSAALTKAAIFPLFSATLIFGLGYLAIGMNYRGSVDIQIPNTLSLKVQNLDQNK